MSTPDVGIGAAADGADFTVMAKADDGAAGGGGKCHCPCLSRPSTPNSER